MRLDTTVKRSPGIGLTPLIDVVFILLVFFMLATRFSVLQSSPMQLRAAGAAGAEAAVTSLHVLDGNYIRLDGEKLARGQLADWLAGHPQRRLVVTTADSVTLQTTLEVIEAIEAAGHQAVDLALLGQEAP